MQGIRENTTGDLPVQDHDLNGDPCDACSHQTAGSRLSEVLGSLHGGKSQLGLPCSIHMATGSLLLVRQDKKKGASASS